MTLNGPLGVDRIEPLVLTLNRNFIMLSFLVRRTGCCVLTLLLCCPLMAADTPAFRWQKPVTLGETSKSGLIAVPLDSQVYSSTRDAFPDVRLLDAEGQSVPFLIRKQSFQEERTTRGSWIARNPELKPTEQGLEIRLTLDKDDPQPTGLSFVTPLKSFDQRVEVHGTEPDQTEVVLVKDALIFDYSQFMPISRLDVPLPANRCRSFRINLKTLTADQESDVLQLTRLMSEGGAKEIQREECTTIQRRAFRIERIEFWSESKKFFVKKDVEAKYAVSKFEVSEDLEKHETTISVTSRREPLTELSIETDHNNFRRAVQVLVPKLSGVRTEWHEIASGSLSKFEIAGIREERLKVSFPEQRHESYRIVISHGDSRPLAINGVVAAGVAYEAVCLAEPAKPQTLVYGADLAEFPKYDLAALQLAFERGLEPAVAKVGDQAEATPAQKMPVNVRGLINNPVVIGAVVCGLVGLLSISLMKAGRRLAELPPSESGDD